MYYKPGNLSALSFPNHNAPAPPDNQSTQKRNLLLDSFTLFLDNPVFPGKTMEISGILPLLIKVHPPWLVFNG
jgi:hypothetical protein